jgi:hypothetical protein
VYFFISQGIINTQVLNNLTTGVLIEAPPLVASEEYIQMLNHLMEIRSRTLGLVTSFLNDYFKNKKVVTIRWFAPNDELELNHRDYFVAPRWQTFTQAEIKNELIRQKRIRPSYPSALYLDHISLWFALSFRAYKTDTENHVFEQPTDTYKEIFLAPEQLLLGVLLQGLEYLGYLDEKRQPTILARALIENVFEYEEQALLLLDLIRTGFVTGNRMKIIPPVIPGKTYSLFILKNI